MKKIVCMVIACMLVAGFALAEDKITVISREDGSGTLAAFTELFGIDEIDERAVITNSTAVMLVTVAGDKASIGYVSMGALNDTVKALKIDGVEPTQENILAGTYKIARPFNIVTNGELNEVASDFISFIMSVDGQAVVTENGCVSVLTADAEPTEYASTMPKGEIVVAGSSSVTPVMEKLIEAYAIINPNAYIELQQSDSSTGVSSVNQGVCDIGMASRELKDSEIEAGAVATVIAMDGIAVIVNPENAADDLTSETVSKIFAGETVDWTEALK